MDAATRALLRSAVASSYPWVEDPRLGPNAVEAGECDGCGGEARLVMTCGPGLFQFLGRQCLLRMGNAAFCDGHADDATLAREWVRGLPAEADLIARIWWVATGEVRLPDEQVAQAVARLALPVDSAGTKARW